VRAAVYHGREDVRVEARPDPGEPAPGEVLLRVARAAICGTDAAEFAYGPKLVPLERPHPASGHVGPVVLGHEFVGVVEVVGEGVEDVRSGHRVVSGAGVSCGTCDWCAAGRTNLCASYYTLGLQVDGGLAEYVRTPAAICRSVPDGCSDDAAAMAQPLAVALHALRRAAVERGQAVAVVGVGGIGAFVVAGAKARGASPLIAVDIDDRRLEAAKALGADHVVDARSGRVAEEVRALTGDGADVVVEASGATGSPAVAIEAAKRGGEVVLVGLQAAPSTLDLADLALREVNLTTSLAHVCAVDLPEALELLAGSELAHLVLDRVIPLAALVESGLVPLAEGTARGKILVDIAAP
jgi:(R,R)-butanediol dehydrogenase / meso-butanediol dehydrogenase / diacetyl reductase